MTKNNSKRNRQTGSAKPSVGPIALEQPSAILPVAAKVLPILIAIAIAAVPFIAGKYMEILRDGPFDGGANTYAAQAIVDGAKINQDIFPSARPATLLVNVVGVAVFGYSELGPKVIQMLMQIAALAILYYTLRKIYGNLPAAIALVCASLFLSYPLFAKYGNVKEQYMITCMIIAACSLILRHIGHKWFWLIISGAAAINIVYFKPTGASVIIAMAIYIIAQPIFKHRSLKQTGQDILLLLAGAAIGILPLFIFYAQQGQLTALYHATPGLKALSNLVPTGTASAKNAAASTDYISGSRQVTTFAEQYQWVTKFYHWLIAPIALALVAVMWALIRRIHSIIQRFITAKPNSLADHPADSDQASIPKSTTPNTDRFVLLFSLWWILDMLFIWISPRSYVEYFLPLNASAAALTAYAIYRIQRHAIWGVPALILACIICNLITVAHLPEGNWPSGWLIPAVVSVPIIVIFTLLHMLRLRKALLLLVAIATLFIWSLPAIADFSSRVSKLSQNRAAARELANSLTQAASINVQNQVAAQKGFAPWFYPSSTIAAAWRHAVVSSLQEDATNATWQIAGWFVRQNSQPDDDLYVWGWFPGIYVTAQRSCPSPRPSEANMHTHSPSTLTNTINTLVQHLTANPPRYIIDSQKMHFPYYTHPVFDLWPRMRINEQRQFAGFDLRMMPRFSQDTNLSYMRLQDFDATADIMLNSVRQFTYAYLTHQQHKGGPLPPEQAQQQAEQEALRHQAMFPLRRFVMQNYQPLMIPGSEIYIFELVSAQ